jgi:hypothetical protein
MMLTSDGGSGSASGHGVQGLASDGVHGAPEWESDDDEGTASHGGARAFYEAAVR